ncbi:MAG TPA: heparin lyase I family protein [Treponemataceae bacterium]|nr:heparin lyase I family protein [Treponemataceae bacterium]
MTKYVALLIGVIAILSCKTNNAVDVDNGSIALASLNFENSNHDPWESQYNARNFEVVTDLDPRINKCGMFQLFEGEDYWTSPSSGIKTARSEIQLPNSGRCHSTMFYGWDFKISDEYAESDEWQIIGQFHDQPDATAGETWQNYPAHSPPLAIKYKNGKVIIAVYSWDTNGVMDIASVGIAKGLWNTIKIKTHWSTGSDGSVEVWLNGLKMQAADGQSVYTGRNCFNKACNYLKIGLYRDTSITTKGIVYFDNIVSSFDETALE